MMMMVTLLQFSYFLTSVLGYKYYILRTYWPSLQQCTKEINRRPRQLIREKESQEYIRILLCTIYYCLSHIQYIDKAPLLRSMYIFLSLSLLLFFSLYYFCSYLSQSLWPQSLFLDPQLRQTLSNLSLSATLIN